MKLLPSRTRSSSRTAAVTAGDDASAVSTSTLQPTLSLQTLPSVPSLSLSHLLHSSIALIPTLTITLSLSSPITSLSLSSHHLFAASGHLISAFHSSSLLPILTFNSSSSSGLVKSLCSPSPHLLLSSHQNGLIKAWQINDQCSPVTQDSFSPDDQCCSPPSQNSLHPSSMKTTNSNSTRRETTSPRSHNNNNLVKLITSLPTLPDRLTKFPLPKNHVQIRRHKTGLWITHHDAVSSLAVNSDVIYSVSWDKTLKVWAPKRGFKCMESITAHDDAINCVTVSVDGIVYTGSADGRIKVWLKPGPTKKHCHVATLEKHKSAVNALVLSDDGSVLFSGACDRSILVWEREDGGEYMRVSGALRGHGGAILCLINVGRFLISGSADRTVRIWTRGGGGDGTYCCLSVLEEHKKAVKCLVGRMEGEDVIRVFSGGLDGEIKVWKVKVNYS